MPRILENVKNFPIDFSDFAKNVLEMSKKITKFLESSKKVREDIVREDIFDHLTVLLREINNSNKFTSKVVTDVHPLNFDDWQGKSGVVEKTFWPAENYHENYFNKNKNNTYCSVVIAPKINIIEKNYPNLIKN